METVSKRQTRFYQALISVVVMAALMFACIVGLGADPQIPLILGCLVAGAVALWARYTWDEILEGMIEGITQSLEAILILMLIGMLVGMWIAAGTVPTMIFYGLSVINADFFLPTTMLITTLVAFAIGSWGTVGTVGLAFMGIGVALGIPAPVVAGCVVSGAYLGEIVSPLSDATNLTAAVVGKSVFSIVRRIVPLAVVGLVVSEVIYLAMSLLGDTTAAAGATSDVDALMQNLSAAFNITPVALIPVVLVVACIVLKVPAIPSMLFGSLCAAVVAVFLQGADLASLVAVSYEGFVSNTGQEMIDNLLTAGGLNSMMYAISIIVIAMAFGGVMRSTGQMEALIAPLVVRLKSFAALNGTTVLSCIGMNVILPDQYLGISVPGQMFADEYGKRHLSQEDLSLALLGGGAVSSPLIPWNTCGIYCMGILGVGAAAYAPFAVFCLAMPVITVAYGVVASRKLGRKAQEQAVKEEIACPEDVAFMQG